MTARPTSLAIDRALCAFAAEEAPPAELFTPLFDPVRPADPRDVGAARANYRLLLDTLAANPAYRKAVRKRVFAVFARRCQTEFFADSGVLPDTGFFTELWRRLTDRVLPGVPDAWSPRDALDLVFHDCNDRVWLAAVPPEMSREFWGLLHPRLGEASAARDAMLAQMLDAPVVLAHRASAMGVEPELTRLHPELVRHESPFLAQAAEAQAFSDAYRPTLADARAPFHDERHLLGLLDQCRQVCASSSPG